MMATICKNRALLEGITRLTKSMEMDLFSNSSSNGCTMRGRTNNQITRTTNKSGGTLTSLEVSKGIDLI